MIAGGLCYQGFVEAFIILAEKKFHSNNYFDSFQALLEQCESNLNDSLKDKKSSARITGRGQMFPSLNKSESFQDDKLTSYVGSRRKKQLSNNYFLDYRNFSADSSKSQPAPTAATAAPLYSTKKVYQRSQTNITRSGGRLGKPEHGGGKTAKGGHSE